MSDCRLNSLLDSLEKITRNLEFSKYTADEMNSVKLLLMKINKCLRHQNEAHLNTGQYAFNQLFVSRILSMLETCKEKIIIWNTVEILLSLLEGSAHARAKFLAYHPSATQILLRTLSQEARTLENCDEFLLDLHRVLAYVGPKDPKFAIKVKSLHTAKVTVSLFKRHMGCPDNLIPLLKVLKLCCGEVTNLSLLAKTPAVSSLLDILNAYLRKNDKLVKLVLLTYVMLFKNKCCVEMFVARGGVENFLDSIENLAREDTRSRALKIRGSFLVVLSHVVCFKAGQTAMQKVSGVGRLYDVCLRLKSSRKLDAHCLLACNVARNCMLANKLPVASVSSPFKVTAPAEPAPRPSRSRSLIFHGEPDGTGRSFATTADDAENCSTPSDEPRTPSDDLGIVTDHYTRGFFDPSSILNTNVGRGRCEPSELRLRNLFSLVSLQDETNKPFSGVPPAAVAQPAVGAPGALGILGRRDDRKKGAAQSEFFLVAREEDYSERGQPGSHDALLRSNEALKRSAGAEAEERESVVEEEEDRLSAEAAAADERRIYEVFFEELALFEKLTLKYEGRYASGQSDLTRSNTTKSFMTDSSLNSNKCSNCNKRGGRDSDDGSGLDSSSSSSSSSGSTGSDVSIGDQDGRSLNVNSRQEDRWSSSGSDSAERGGPRPEDSQLNRCSSSNRGVDDSFGGWSEVLRDGSPGSGVLTLSSDRNEFVDLDSVIGRSASSMLPGRPTLPSSSTGVDSDSSYRKGSAPSGTRSTDTACVTLKALRGFFSIDAADGLASRRRSGPGKARKSSGPSGGESKVAARADRTSAGSPPPPLPGRKQSKRRQPPSKRSLTGSGSTVPSGSQSLDAARTERQYVTEELARRIQDSNRDGFRRSYLDVNEYHAPCAPSGQGRRRERHITEESNFRERDKTNRDVERYLELAQKTSSLTRFTRVAYPDLYGHVVPPREERSQPYRRTEMLRSRMMEDIRREVDPSDLINTCVYNADEILIARQEAKPCLFNDDETCILNALKDSKRLIRRHTHLTFDSLFESGNLRKAIQVREYEYDLILMPDVNTRGQHQWFYFRVADMRADVPYRFNIVNCEKANSQFNFGMQPVIYSVAEAVLGRPYWIRVGDGLCYYRNHMLKTTYNESRLTNLCFYYTATFTVTFPHEPDVCYLAYHYPYTYTSLMFFIDQLRNANNNGQDRRNSDSVDPWGVNGNNASSSNKSSSIDSGTSLAGRTPSSPSVMFFKHQVLCRSLGGNEVPLITVTAMPGLTGNAQADAEAFLNLRSRPYVFLSARVHPGESNSSWVMRGTLQFLLGESDTAQQLRESFVFKIIPMLNPDGVINGNHRCSLLGDDLNRQWLEPSFSRHASIFHAKALMLYLQSRSPSSVYTFCDFHGHSRKKNVFIYGCSPLKSWITDDQQNPTIRQEKVEDESYKVIPAILEKIAPGFHLPSCSYAVEKTKETTARVVVWRQVGVMRSYTMESTYCGYDQGPYKGMQINTALHEEMGRLFAMAVGLSRASTEDLRALLSSLSSDDVEKSKRARKMSETRAASRDSSESSESAELEHMLEEYNESLAGNDSEEKLMVVASSPL